MGTFPARVNPFPKWSGRAGPVCPTMAHSLWTRPMRKIPLLLGLLACTALTGCDWWHKAPPQHVTCHCTAPAPMAAAPVDVAPARTAMRGSDYTRERRVRRHHYRHYAHRHHYDGYRWHKRQAERSVDIYGYSSASRSYGGGSAHGYAYGYGSGHGGDCCGGHARGRSGTTRVWADGYGRRHIYDESAVRHYAWQAHVRRKGEGARLDPWHGYDDDWN